MQTSHLLRQINYERVKNAEYKENCTSLKQALSTILFDHALLTLSGLPTKMSITGDVIPFSSKVLFKIQLIGPTQKDSCQDRSR